MALCLDFQSIEIIDDFKITCRVIDWLSNFFVLTPPVKKR